MKITLVVATHNGEESLAQSLESLEQVHIPKDVTFNTIYIDNNSDDNTSYILKNFEPEFSHTVLSQLKKGKNSALNTIFEHHDILGDFLIFSDDDVIFSKDFITNYASLFRNYPNHKVFGGIVTPHWQKVPSEELLNGIDEVVAFAVTPPSRGYAPGEIEPEKLHGPNMALKKEIFNNGFRFNEDIGPNGGNYMMGSESELLLRLKAQNYKAIFAEDVQVKHIIFSYQLSPKWLKGRAYKAGRSMLMHQLKTEAFKRVPEFFYYPRWAVKQRIKHYLMTLLYMKNSKNFYRSLWLSNHLRGYCDEYKKYVSREIG